MMRLGAVELELCAADEAERAPGVFLSPEESRAFQGLRVAKRRRDWAAGRLAAKRLAKRALPDAPEDLSRIEIRRLDTGEPYVELPGSGRRPISISHSGGAAAAALAHDGGRLGLDIETVEPRAAVWLEILAHPDEAFPGLPSDPAAQTVLWTLKEAALKLLGLGLSVDLHGVRFLPDPAGTAIPSLGTARLELSGKAREKWRSLGSPSIRFESVLLGPLALSVAYSQRRLRSSLRSFSSEAVSGALCCAGPSL